MKLKNLLYKPDITPEVYWRKRFVYMLLCFMFATTIFIGGVMNFLAIVKNGEHAGKMPIDYNRIQYDYVNEDYFTFYDKDDINFWYFSDIIPIGSRAIASLGDLVMFISFLGAGYCVTKDCILYYRDKYGREIA